MKAQAFTLIDALPLGFFRGICNVDCNERRSVKKTALFQGVLSFLAKERLKGK